MGIVLLGQGLILRHMPLTIPGMKLPLRFLLCLVSLPLCAAMQSCRTMPSELEFCALYRQSAGSCVFGLSPRPAFPKQDQVAKIVQMAFQKNFRTCAYNWWPPIDLSSQPEACPFQWKPPVGSWHKLQKTLKEGTRKARLMRASLHTL